MAKSARTFLFNSMPFFKALLLSPEYSFSNVIGYFKGAMFSVEALWEPFMACDMATLGYDFQVPIFLFLGRHDYQVPAVLASDYFRKIQAPYKELVWFEESAHGPMSEETKKFADELVKRVLPFADNNS